MLRQTNECASGRPVSLRSRHACFGKRNVGFFIDVSALCSPRLLAQPLVCRPHTLGHLNVRTCFPSCRALSSGCWVRHCRCRSTQAALSWLPLPSGRSFATEASPTAAGACSARVSRAVDRAVRSHRGSERTCSLGLGPLPAFGDRSAGKSAAAVSFQ